LLRWETLPYPLFCEPEWSSIYQALSQIGHLDLQVHVPNPYTVLTSLGESKEVISSHPGMKAFQFANEDTRYSNLTIVVAPYTIQDTEFGKFFLLSSPLSKEKISQLLEAKSFLNQSYGNRDSGSKPIYATIPHGFGSFALPDVKVIFIQQSAIESSSHFRQVIHEYIHLYWNVPALSTVQRMRFFDEAFTCYFEIKTMEYLQADEGLLASKITTFKQQMASGIYKNVPIVQYGLHEQGGLSYTLGAIFLYRLQEFIGEEWFNRIIRDFLQKYQDTPVVMSDFENAFLEGVEPEKKVWLREFLDRWLYTTSESDKLL